MDTYKDFFKYRLTRREFIKKTSLASLALFASPIIFLPEIAYSFDRRELTFKQGLDIEMYSVRSKGYSDISVELKNHIKANLIRPLTKQDKYIKCIVEEALKETLEKYQYLEK